MAFLLTQLLPTITKDAKSDHCTHLTSPNPYTVTLAAIILIGILISYLPQHIKIISRRSSEGLSPWWVLLGGLSSIAAIGNILVLPASRADAQCCREVSGPECAAALLGIAQIGLQWGCFMFIVMLFLTFFPTHQPAPTDLSSSTASLSAPPPKRRSAILVGTLILLSLFAVGLTSIALVAREGPSNPSHTRTQTWADFLGTVAGVLSAVQYLPQIYFTWKLKGVKSLSIVTMVIQVPGAFLFAFSLWLRVGWEGWSTWLVYVVTGILQAILLTLAITYLLAARKEEKDGGGEGDVEEEDVSDAVAGSGAGADERTALLSNGHKARPIHDTQRSERSNNSQRSLGMLYAATPPEHDSDRS